MSRTKFRVLVVLRFIICDIVVTICNLIGTAIFFYGYLKINYCMQYTATSQSMAVLNLLKSCKMPQV